MAYLVVISKQLIQEINSFSTNKALVLRIDKRMPVLLRKASEDIVILRIELDLILVEIVKEVFRTKNLGDLDKLVRVAVPVKEWFFPEDHGSEHST